MKTQTGTLYGIGVGPGDPDLITVKALTTLAAVPVIFAASSTKNDYSISQGIVRKHLPHATIEKLAFPMTRDREALSRAWQSNARSVLDVLEAGKDAAFVTLGDPMTYSTFSYLLRTIREMAPGLRVVTIPGITSYQAAAALANSPIAEGEEAFYLVSGARGGDNLRKVIRAADNVVMLKAYKHFDDIYAAIEELGLLDRSVLVSRLGMNGETMVEDFRSLKGQQIPYLSLVIIKKNGVS